MKDISGLDIDQFVGKMSREDLDRMRKHKPQTLQAAIRAGVKPTGIALLYHTARKGMVE